MKTQPSLVIIMLVFWSLYFRAATLILAPVPVEVATDAEWCALRQVSEAGGGLDKRLQSFEIPDGQEDDAEMSRRAPHPHMNNLVYGRRSDPAASVHLSDGGLSSAVCRQVINRCARWQRQPNSDSD